MSEGTEIHSEGDWREEDYKDAKEEEGDAHEFLCKISGVDDLELWEKNSIPQRAVLARVEGSPNLIRIRFPKDFKDEDIKEFPEGMLPVGDFEEVVVWRIFGTSTHGLGIVFEPPETGFPLPGCLVRYCVNESHQPCGCCGNRIPVIVEVFPGVNSEVFTDEIKRVHLGLTGMVKLFDTQRACILFMLVALLGLGVAMFGLPGLLVWATAMGITSSVHVLIFLLLRVKKSVRYARLITRENEKDLADGEEGE